MFGVILKQCPHYIVCASESAEKLFFNQLEDIFVGIQFLVI